jgi:hypothetical protein
MRGIEVIQEITSGTGEAIQLDDLGTYRDAPITDDLNPNDIPSWENVNDLMGNIPVFTPPVEVPFTDSISIDWQTDIPPGQTDTYATLYGNLLPLYNIYSGNDTDGYDSSSPSAHVTRSGGIIDTVSFDQPGEWILRF